MTKITDADIDRAKRAYNDGYVKGYTHNESWRAALETLQGGEVGEGWRPIEAAPQNNVDVLVCMNNGHGSICIARTPGTKQWWDASFSPIPTPTHWMPLPAAPSHKETGE